MSNSPLSATASYQILDVSRTERWFIQHRLQELSINCSCPSDGTLWVEVHHGLEALLVRSTFYHLNASRQEQVDWLERCWSTANCTSDYS
ncbi:MAG: Asr1405/Asl0597 family protein [Microcystaceae cyanobacterium]